LPKINLNKWLSFSLGGLESKLIEMTVDDEGTLIQGGFNPEDQAEFLGGGMKP